MLLQCFYLNQAAYYSKWKDFLFVVPKNLDLRWLMVEEITNSRVGNDKDDPFYFFCG